MNKLDIKIGQIVKKPTTYLHSKSTALDTYKVIGFTKKRVRVLLLAIDDKKVSNQRIESYSANSFTEIVECA